MSWRFIQLGNGLCDQDLIIMKLFENQPVKYIGNDHEFKQKLQTSADAENLVLILNTPMWISEIIKTCQRELVDPIKTCYIGVNRYHVLGNDTAKVFDIADDRSVDILNFITGITTNLGFAIIQSGYYTEDLGQRFNFVQPLTWIYAHKITD